jgi:DNA polymerase-3 subunit beta
MKFSIIVSTLLSCLSKLAPAMGHKNLPILKFVLIDVSTSGLVMTASNLDLQVTDSAILQNGVKESFKICLEGKKLLDICKSLQQDQLMNFTFDAEKGQATIKSGKSRFTICTQPANDFPLADAAGFKKTIVSCEVPSLQIAKLFASTAFAMASNDVRYYLNGLYFKLGKTGVQVVSTDGHRLSLGEYTCPLAVEGEGVSVIIPRDNVGSIQAILSKSDKVTIDLTESYIRVNDGSQTIVSKLIDGKFPDYTRVIPRENPITAKRNLAVYRLISGIIRLVFAP